MSITEIHDAALKLNEEDRSDLLAVLLDSLDGADPNDSNDDSLTEARRRGEELASGKVKGMTEKELMDEIRASRTR